jgi:hypothetical protein
MAARALPALALALAMLAPAAYGASVARPATRSEHAALVAAFGSQDGNTSEIRSIYVSRSNSALAVVCVRTPEGGPEAAVFHRTGRSWRLRSSGRPGSTGSATERRLELVCG